MKTHILAFPLAIAAIMALDGCEGISLNDPSIRLCHDDTTHIPVTFNGRVVGSALMIRQDDPRTCRAA